ncbi:hypothetical protein CKO40_20650 [Halochromatium glycolicum]|uniref:Uncharacterized protein n=1 Tax=Halochromatium glycolicum TaxID=85075 RepID=A0AAJ0XBK6_9GAMM|nr:hypothetical protein [Halochromatium glycolicum]
MKAVDQTYLTSRGHWYHASRKDGINKSVGVATNIDVHFYDMLSRVFGPVSDSVVHLQEADVAAGYLRERTLAGDYHPTCARV